MSPRTNSKPTAAGRDSGTVATGTAAGRDSGTVATGAAALPDGRRERRDRAKPTPADTMNTSR